MKSRIHEHLARNIEQKNEEATSLALAEIRDLKNDLVEIEKVLTGKKKGTKIALMDIPCGAFEVYKNVALIFQNMEMLDSLGKGREEAKIVDYLDRRGARLLKKPEGWHWFSPQGEMVFLGGPDDVFKAGQKLKTLLTRKARGKSTAVKKTDTVGAAEVKQTPLPESS